MFSIVHASDLYEQSDQYKREPRIDTIIYIERTWTIKERKWRWTKEIREIYHTLRVTAKPNTKNSKRTNRNKHNILAHIIGNQRYQSR